MSTIQTSPLLAKTPPQAIDLKAKQVAAPAAKPKPALPKTGPKKDAPMTAASRPTWAPGAKAPTKAADYQKSTNDWVAGKITTAQHKQNLKQAKAASKR